MCHQSGTSIIMMYNQNMCMFLLIDNLGECGSCAISLFVGLSFDDVIG